jgi:hypothetical protein
MEMRAVHKNLPAVLCIGALAACGPPSTPVVSGDGFGAVRFGMKIAEAEKALGHKLKPESEPGENEFCRYFTPEGAFPGLAFMTAKGEIVRLDVQETKDIVTDKGAKIGDSESHVLDLYKGRVRVEEHEYTGPEGHYLVVTGGDGKVQLVFETDGKTVVSYRAGVEPQVEYVEGCL